MNSKQAGVLLHPTSLPNQKGQLGKLDEQAWRFVDWMEQAGLTLWQMLPLTEPLCDLSPYQSLSAFALNPALLPDNWHQDYWDESEFARYKQTPPHWLEDYALFCAIREQQQLHSWVDWPEPLKFRDPVALAAFAKEHSVLLERLKAQQFVLAKVWAQLKRYANQKNIQMFGDVPIFVAFDSADVWANPQAFKLDEALHPTHVTGVPPDYFSETGQRWGNPHYNWEAMQEDEFAWWRQRIGASLEQFDLVRIDHFRGLEAAWEIEASESTAMQGVWQKAPGDKLLAAIQADYPHLPLVAEDLGIITDEVVALKEHYNLPGMSVLQFGFNGLPDNPHSIHEQVENSVTYTGTHDNDTSLGWFTHSLDEGSQHWVLEQLMPIAEPLLTQAGLPKQMPWPLIAVALSSVAQRVMVPMQDILSLNSEHRMNVPGVADDNWHWQFQWSQVPEALAPQLRTLVQSTHRLSQD